MKTKRRKFDKVTDGNVTVKIYEHGRKSSNGKPRTDFLISDYTTGARRLRWFADRDKARAEAKKVARQLSTGQTTAATMRNSEAASYGRAIELLRPTGAPLELAAAHFAEAFKILGGDKIIEAAKFYKLHNAGELTRKSVAAVITEMITVKQNDGLSKRYTDDLKSRLDIFSETFKGDISSVSTGDVQRFIDGLKLAPKTKKNYRGILRVLFSFAEGYNYILKGSNPVKDTRKIKDAGGDITIYTPDEISGLLKAASPALLPVIAIGAFAGLRAAEIERLEWADIDLVRGQIEVKKKKAKNRSRRLVPIAPNLAQWLADYSKHAGKVQTLTTALMRDARADGCKAAGVTWKDNALRHSFISYRVADIQNTAQVALEAGNTEDVIFNSYRELVKPEDGKAWFAIAPERPGNVVSMAAKK
jgi:integrase